MTRKNNYYPPQASLVHVEMCQMICTSIPVDKSSQTIKGEESLSKDNDSNQWDLWETQSDDDDVN